MLMGFKIALFFIVLSGCSVNQEITCSPELLYLGADVKNINSQDIIPYIKCSTVY